MSDSIITLQNRISGIFKKSEIDDGKGKPIVLFWNAGLLHKVGPYRMYVEFSKELANIGFNSFRFDLTGMGDSESSGSLELDKHRIVSEVKSVVDELAKKTGIDEFVLLGLCSGADNAFDVALVEKRIKGLMLLDGYTYTTPKYILNKWISKLSNLMSYRKVRAFLRSKLHLFFNGEGKEPVSVMGYVREFPEVEEFRKSLRQLQKRNIGLYMVYSGGYPGYLYKDQFYDFSGVVKASDDVQVTYFDKADHMYIVKESRDELLLSMLEWLKQNFTK